MSAGVHLVIVHHDQPERCARSADAFARQDGIASMTVVDSGRRPPLGLPAGAEVLGAGGNVGFGPGANLGLRRWLAAGEGEWVAVAPHDAVPEEGCVRRLLDAVEGRGDAGLVCAEFGEAFDVVPVVDKVMGGYYRPAPRRTGWQDVDYPHGTLLLARRAMLDDVGLFDERYFAYCEEVDLALRARAAGWRVGMVWGAVVANGRLPDQRLAGYLQLRNTLLLVGEHFGRREVRARLILAAAGALARALREPARALPVGRLEARAIEDFLRHRFGPPPEDLLRPVAWRP
ncbi:MAG: glycosyltransferase family 2 protein [Actinomycetota bacterium]|nr:glycosyltransferase family 2 protein [Actinomycetota bacterium]